MYYFIFCGSLIILLLSVSTLVLQLQGAQPQQADFQQSLNTYKQLMTPEFQRHLNAYNDGNKFRKSFPKSLDEATKNRIAEERCTNNYKDPAERNACLQGVRDAASET